MKNKLCVFMFLVCIFFLCTQKIFADTCEYTYVYSFSGSIEGKDDLAVGAQI